MHDNAKKRQQILEVLYQARQANTRKLDKYQSVPLSELNDAVDDVDFALSVLIELNLIQRNGDRVRITGTGILACEQAQH